MGSSTGFSAGGSTLTVATQVPAASKAGDFLIVSVTAERGLIPELSGMTGLTAAHAAADGTNVSVRTAYKILSAADLSATVTAKVTSARRMAIATSVWRGVGSVSLATGAAATQSGTSLSTPPVTPTRGDAVIVGVVGYHSNTAPWTTSFTPGSGHAERAEVTSTHPSAANPSTYVVDRAVVGGAGSAQPGTKATSGLSNSRYLSSTFALGPRTEREKRALLIPGVDQPTSANTGLLPDVPLVQASGNVNLNTAGAVYENRDLAGSITVSAPNVTIRNVRIRGQAGVKPTNDSFLIAAFGSNVSNLLIEHVTLRPDSPHAKWNGISGHDYTARFVDVSHVTDGFNVYNTNVPAPKLYPSGVTIEQSYCHDLVRWTAASAGTVHPSDTETHNDCIQHQGGSGTVIRGNTLKAGPFAKQVGHWRTTTNTEPYTTVPLYSLPDGGPYREIPDRGTGVEATGRYNVGDQANLMIGANVGPSYNLDVTDNWLYGGNYSVNGGGNPPGDGRNLGRFLRNRFDRTQGDQSTGGDNTHTITLGAAWGSLVNSGAGTADANRYINDGHEINFRGD